MVGGVYLQYNKISYPPEWATHKLKNNYITESLWQEWEFWTQCQHFHPSTGKMSPQNIWLWRPAQLNYRSSKGLREIETSLWKSVQKTSHAPEQRQKQ